MIVRTSNVSARDGVKHVALAKLFDPVATARGSDTSCDDQTQSHDQIENHHYFRVAPVVMHDAAAHEAEQSAQRAQDKSFFNPILLRYSSLRFLERPCIRP